jgi:NET1-associated nuclear protein 1 (U3 small nucleolar RNA-associated protein 17)
MADTTPQLKRKRESTIGGSNRKSKKQREAERDAAAGEEAAAASVAGPAQDVQTTQTPTDKSKSKSRKSQSNGDTIKTPAITTTSKLKPTPQPKSLPDGESDAPDAHDIPSSTSNEKTPKKERITGADKRVKNNTEEARALKAARKKKAEEDKARKEAKKEELRLEVAAKAEAKKIKQEKQEGRTAAKALIKSKNKSRGTWNASPAHGGWFLPQDPVFSSDEKHIIVATPRAVQVYTAETSLLAHALSITSPSTIVTAFALSATKPNQLYVADSTHLVTLWNWVEGTKLGRWQIGAMVRQMVVIAQPGSDEDLVYCHESSGKSQVINVHALRTKEQASQTELKQVLKQTDRVQRLQVLLQGKYVIVTSNRSITIGKRLRASKTAVKDFDYVWRELQFSNTITTCDVYHRRPAPAENGKKSAEPEKDILDLAVGDEIGVILLFEDILASFAASERSQRNQTIADSAEEFRPKRLHWHRNAVGSVRWSLDGTLSGALRINHD